MENIKTLCENNVSKLWMTGYVDKISLKLFLSDVSKLKSNVEGMWKEGGWVSWLWGHWSLITKLADPSSLTIISNHQTLQTTVNIFLSKRAVTNLWGYKFYHGIYQSNLKVRALNSSVPDNPNWWWCQSVDENLVENCNRLAGPIVAAKLRAEINWKWNGGGGGGATMTWILPLQKKKKKKKRKVVREIILTWRFQDIKCDDGGSNDALQVMHYRRLCTATGVALAQYNE